MNVDAYLDAASRRRWIYGGGEGGFKGHDCTLFIANWCVHLGFPDPGKGIRGTYGTQAAAENILRSYGGIVAFFDERLVSIGWVRAGYPRNRQDGDVALLLPAEGGRRLVNAGGLIPAIRRGGVWVSPDPVGLVASMLPDRALWRPAA